MSEEPKFSQKEPAQGNVEKEIKVGPRTMLVGGGLFLVIVGGILLWSFFNAGDVSKVETPPLPPEKGITSQDAMSVGIAKAKEWQQDAELLNFSSKEGETGGREGKSVLWTFLFVSSSKTKLAYRVTVEDPGAIIEAVEIPWQSKVNPVEELAPEDIITTEEAIAKVRAIPGYENTAVLGVEAEYGPLGKVWYWNVKTEKGNVSIHALRNEKQ